MACSWCYCSRVQRQVLEAGQGASPTPSEEAGPALAAERPRVSRSDQFFKRSDLLGMAWVIGSAIALLVPELIHTRILGPFDILSRLGLTKQPGVPIQSLQNSDLINSLIPWTTIAWHQVHQGHLPIWNPYNGLGMPLAFNWQTAPFGLPALVGYAVPVRYAFTTGVIVNLLVAGSGAYVLGRVLKMGVVASATVGTVFELSGSIVAWLGFPFPSVISWAGSIFAIGLLILRGRHRAGCIVALAVCIALALNGGAPEGFTVMMLAAGLFFALMLLYVPDGQMAPARSSNPAADLAVAAVSGVALAAPFALPGFQLSKESVRSLSSNGGSLTWRTLVYLPFQDFDGLPIVRNGHAVLFGYSLYYTETATYVGVSALVLAGLAIFIVRSPSRGPGIRSRRGTLCSPSPLPDRSLPLTPKVPLFGQVNLIRALMPMALLVAVLAGFGIDVVVRFGQRQEIRSPAGHRIWLFGAVGLLMLWVFGRGHLPPAATSIREHSFIWPAVEAASGLAAAGFLLWVSRQRERADRRLIGHGASQPFVLRWSGAIAGVGLLAVQTAFLVSAGASMIQSSAQTFPQTPATNALVAKVGTATVGFGSQSCVLGIVPNANGVYGVHELAVYDPIVPKKYFSTWIEVTGSPGGVTLYNSFCPAVSTTAVAKEFGVGFILERSGQAGPTGSVYVGRLGDEELYRIPGAGEATVSPLRAGVLPPDEVVGTPVVVHHPSPSRWQLTTSSTEPVRAPPPSHRRARLARHDRRKAASARNLCGHHAAGPDPGWNAYDRPSLLAAGVHRGNLIGPDSARLL